MNTENPVVIDLGSESIKAGYAAAVPSEQEPRIITPSLVHVQPRAGGGQAAAAGAANGASASGRLVRVVERGAVTDPHCLDAMLHHLLYDQLGWVKGEEGAVLFVEPLFVGKGEREVLTQLMFEGFNVAGLFLHDAASLSLAAAGKLNGCSVDIGHGKVDIATVSEGVMHAPGAVRMSFAGEQLTQVLGQCLAQQQPGLPQLSQQQLSALKVACCRAAPSAEAYAGMLAAPPPPYRQPHRGNQAAAAAAAAAAAGAGPSSSSGGQAGEQQQQDADEEAELPPLGAPQEYALPDGSTFTVGSEGVSTAEALFNPCPVYGLPHTPGLVDCILQCINELPDASARRSALDGLLLCGGGACIQGIGTRVQQELRSQLPNGLHPRMTSLPEYMCAPSPQYVQWVGGAVMAKLAAYQSHFMIKAEYEECGASAVHRKCA